MSVLNWARRASLAAGACAVASLALVAPAHASVSPYLVGPTGRCAAWEFTELHGGHDYMRANPVVDWNGVCRFGIHDFSTGADYPTNGGAETPEPGIYDGPGHIEAVYVHDLLSDDWGWGPRN
ncbi:hypothetical protein AB0L06_00120 [Spirillospora sp. NPDC052269]